MIEVRDQQRVGEAVKVTTASGKKAGDGWVVPESGKKTQYGESYVVATHCGIISEMDCTKGARSWRLYHPSDSYIEIHEDGTYIQKVAGIKWDQFGNNHHTYVHKDRWTSVNGNEDFWVGGDSCIERKGNKEEKIIGESKYTVVKEYKLTVGDKFDILGQKDQTLTANMNQSIVAGQNQDIKSIGIQTLETLSNQIIRVFGNQDTTIYGTSTALIGATFSQTSGGTTQISSGGAMFLYSSGTIFIKGKMVMINP